MGVHIPAGPGGGVRVSSDERKLRKQLEETRQWMVSWEYWPQHEAAGRVSLLADGVRPSIGETSWAHLKAVEGPAGAIPLTQP